MFTKMKERKIQREREELKDLEDWKEKLDRKYEDYIRDAERVEGSNTKKLLEEEIEKIGQYREAVGNEITKRKKEGQMIP